MINKTINTPTPTGPKAPATCEFVQNIFEAKTAQKGGVLRRSISSINRFASEATLKAAVKQRGFKLYKTCNHYLIICDISGALKQIK